MTERERREERATRALAQIEACPRARERLRGVAREIVSERGERPARQPGPVARVVRLPWWRAVGIALTAWLHAGGGR